MKCLKLFRFRNIILKRSYSCSSVDIQNAIFDDEADRQKKLIGRIEKIEVSYVGRPENVKLLMNKDMSTPFDVAWHVSDWLVKDGALAIVNETQWDMRRPFPDNCTVQIMTLRDADPYLANRAFWRTCSFLLGAVIRTAFKENVEVQLHSFPSPKIASGSFVHDAWLSLDSWTPTEAELKALSAEFVLMCHAELPIERLSVDAAVASDIFRGDRFKSLHVDAIAKASGGNVTLYRVKDHIDISKGPMVSHTGLIGRATITAVHSIETDDGQLYRFQGIALPRGININYFAYQILADRAKKLNRYDSAFSERKEAALQ